MRKYCLLFCVPIYHVCSKHIFYILFINKGIKLADTFLFMYEAYSESKYRFAVRKIN